MISSTRPSYYCVVSDLVFLGTDASVCIVAYPFTYWNPSVVTVSGGFSVLCVGCPCTLLAESTSMDDAIGICLYSTTGVGSMAASTSEVIASTLMNSSGCLVSFPASTASHGSLLLHVFLPTWLGAPIYGGGIVGTSRFLLTNSSLVHPVSTHFGSACSISLQLYDFTMGLILPMFPLYIGKS